MKTIVAVYDQLEDAYQVIEELRDAGIDRSNISLVRGDPSGEYAPYFKGDENGPDEPVEGALAGGAIGGIAGLLVGVGALVIPGVGPAVAAGPLVSGLVGAGIGAASGGLLGALVDAGIPEEETGHYLEGIRRGGTLVAVRVMNYQSEDVVDIMERNNPIDLDERVESWRRAGWTGFDTETRPDPADTAAWEELEADSFVNYEPAFRQHYEETYRDSGHNYTIYVPAYRYGYQLARDPQYRDWDWSQLEPEIQQQWGERYEGLWSNFQDAIRYAWHEVRSSLEHDEDIDFDASDEYDRAFRQHFQKRYAPPGHTYDEYAPAYHHGYQLAIDTRYQDMDWNEVEPDARRLWQDSHEGPWEQFRDAVRYAWKEVTDSLEGDMEHDDYDMDRKDFGDNNRFRTHYDRSYATSGYDYAHYAPAYEFGYLLADDMRYQNRPWNEIEVVVRERWERDHIGDRPWEQVKDAIRHAWEKAQAAKSL